MATPRPLLPMLALLLAALATAAARRDSDAGMAPWAQYVVTLGPNASATETWAAGELQTWVAAVANVTLDIVAPAKAAGRPQLAVGCAAALATGGVSAAQLAKLGNEGAVLTSAGVAPHLVLSGACGAPRGAIYAVYGLLDDLGVRWYAPDAAPHAPAAPPTPPAYANDTRVPALEYRDHDQKGDGVEPWCVRNRLNGASAAAAPEHGGHHAYASGLFVHTYYKLVPPDTYFATHPEWYSLVDGKRTHTSGSGLAQLCLTNTELQAFVAAQVAAALRADPAADVVSVSQNDHNGGYCECDSCRAAETHDGGAHSGPVLAFANAIARNISHEFPHVTVDTLAYQYTRAPPAVTRPEPNVVVRLCSIECDFGRPFTADTNAKFLHDLSGWSAVSKRLFIWDYVTDFANFVQPFPNWHVIGPNIRTLVKHGVAGVFEEGNYVSAAGEMQPLKGWLMARLLWDPSADWEALTAEFLAAYYGPSSAPYVASYMDAAVQSLQDTNTYLTEHEPPTSDFLTPLFLLEAADMLNGAVDAANGTAPYDLRARTVRLPVWYVILLRWSEVCTHARSIFVDWPLPTAASDAYNEFAAEFTAAGGTALSEGGLDLAHFKAELDLTATCHSP